MLLDLNAELNAVFYQIVLVRASAGERCVSPKFACFPRCMGSLRYSGFLPLSPLSEDIHVKLSHRTEGEWLFASV